MLITEGREIENYLNPKVIEEYLSDKYGGNFLGLVDAGKFGDMLSFKRAGKTEPQQADKIALARFVAGIAPDTGAHTLRKDLNRLVAFIRQAVL